MAKVIPVYKGGDHSSFSNYRPVSVLSTFSKIFERAIVVRLNKYLSKNNILYERQFGFKTNHSTYIAVQDLVNIVSEVFDKIKNKRVMALFVDLSKAFDTINHGIMLQKMQNYGIRGVPLQLFNRQLPK